MDSRVVIGHFLRNSLFLQAFHEGRDRCRIFGKSRLISSPYVLSMLCKTLESDKSHRGYRKEAGVAMATRALASRRHDSCDRYQCRTSSIADIGERAGALGERGIHAQDQALDLGRDESVRVEYAASRRHDRGQTTTPPPEARPPETRFVETRTITGTPGYGVCSV